MFNKNKFEAMLLNHSVSKKDLAYYLNISISYLYKKISNGGDFNVEEIRLMTNLFGRNEVLDCLFDCE